MLSNTNAFYVNRAIEYPKINAMKKHQLKIRLQSTFENSLALTEIQYGGFNIAP